MSAQANVVEILHGNVKLVDKTMAEDQLIYINAGDTLNEGVEVYLSDGALMTLAMQPSGKQLSVLGARKWTLIVVDPPNAPPYVPHTIHGSVQIPAADVHGPANLEARELRQELAQLRLELVQVYRKQGLPALAQPHFDAVEHILDRLSLETVDPLRINFERLRIP